MQVTLTWMELLEYILYFVFLTRQSLCDPDEKKIA